MKREAEACDGVTVEFNVPVGERLGELRRCNRLSQVMRARDGLREREREGERGEIERENYIVAVCH